MLKGLFTDFTRGNVLPDDRAGVEPEPGQPDPSAWDTGGAGSGVSGESTHPGYKTSTGGTMQC